MVFKWETFSESEPGFPEESLGCASVLESFHEYMRRALGRSYYRGEPQTRPRRHAKFGVRQWQPEPNFISISPFLKGGVSAKGLDWLRSLSVDGKTNFL
jgi:hypothetical protein